MERRLLDILERENRPQTISELSSCLPDGQQMSEVHRCLETLIEKGEVVSKRVDFGEAAGSELLYWKTAASSERSESSTPAKRSVVLSTPRSGIGPPSKRSRLPFKSPARIGSSTSTAMGPSTISTPVGPGQKGTAQTPAASLKLTPSSACALVSEKEPRYKDDLAGDVSKMKARLEQVEAEIADLASCGCREEDLQQHIDALHRYNEMKDAGQLLLGKMAELEGTTTTALYHRFGLQLDN